MKTLSSPQKRHFEATLAFIAISGWKPAKMHVGTPVWYALLDAVKFDVTTCKYKVEAAYQSIVDNHPASIAYRWMVRDGWSFDVSDFNRPNKHGGRLLSRGIPMKRTVTSETEKTECLGYQFPAELREEATIEMTGVVRQTVRLGKWVSWSDQVIRGK